MIELVEGVCANHGAKIRCPSPLSTYIRIDRIGPRQTEQLSNAAMQHTSCCLVPAAPPINAYFPRVLISNDTTYNLALPLSYIQAAPMSTSLPVTPFSLGLTLRGHFGRISLYIVLFA